MSLYLHVAIWKAQQGQNILQLCFKRVGAVGIVSAFLLFRLFGASQQS